MRLLWLGIALSLLLTMAAFAADHPHDWIKSFKVPGLSSDCCGKADCVQLEPGALAGKRIGEAYPLPAVGHYPAEPVTIKAIYPAPPGSINGWGCHTGCFFRALGF